MTIRGDEQAELIQFQRSALDRVRNLHRQTAEYGLPSECLEGECDHDATRECPEKCFEVCAHCLANAQVMSDEWWPGWVIWPCQTVLALEGTVD